MRITLVGTVVGVLGCGGGGGGATPDAPPSNDDPDAAVGTIDAAPTPTLGTLTPAGACTVTTMLEGATCERFVVSGCSDLEDATVQLVTAEPTAEPFRGTVVFGSGSAGASLIEQSGGPNFVAAAEALRADGFRVIERAWQGEADGDRGWLRGTEGPAVSACRYATVLTFLAERHDDEGDVCAVGFSGGSMELGMVMARWGLADRLQHALFVSGPASTFDDACVPDEAWSAECAQIVDDNPWNCPGAGTPSCLLSDDIACLLDASYGADPVGDACDPDIAVCAAHDEAYADQLLAGSILAPGATSTFPTTKLDVLVGMKDCGSGAATAAYGFAARVTGADGAPLVTESAMSGHAVHATVDGAAKIRALVGGGCGLPE